MKYDITVLPGDGIGSEITAEAVRVLHKAAALFGFEVDVTHAPIGGASIDAAGVPLSEETIRLCKSSHAVLLGAVGGPKWDGVDAQIRPEKGLLLLRSELGLFANLRPAMVYPALSAASPLKEELLKDGLDIMIVRELTGGIYFGKRGRQGKGKTAFAYDTEEYSASEIERIARVAFTLAEKRKKRLCSVDKANVLETSRLWRATMERVAAEYPQVALSHMYVDNAAMQLVRAPGQFDTIVTSNLFGDILSDEASQITGSIGMLPSASLGAGSLGVYEPVHGSAPDIADKGVANPLAAILSVALLLRYSLSQPKAAQAIEDAVAKTLQQGLRTADIASGEEEALSTAQMGQAVTDALQA
ncbi:MAG: 3-isopropylmalate dehydrogenase [Christensenellales bacterium]|jgi:3-isopropylmalate dehydrogenase